LEGSDGAHFWPLVPVALALIAAWLLFSWPWLIGRVTIPWDAKAHFQPQIQFLAQSLARGESPFWAPYAFSGLPQVADPQSMIFSPPMLLLALVNPAPSLTAVDATVLVMLLAGAAGVLGLARDLGWHWAGGLVAALGFAFGAAMAWRLQHFGQVLSLAYWPFAHLFLKRALERPSAAYGIAAGVVAAFIVLGRDQVGLICIYLLAGYVLWHIMTSRAPVEAAFRAAPALVLGGAVGLAIVALPILMTLLYADISNRPVIDYAGAGAGSLHPALVITMLVPHLFGAAGEMAKYWGPPSFTWEGTGLFIAQNMGQLYIGAAPVLLLWSGLVRGALWEREIRFYTVALALVVLYAVGWYTPAFRVFYEVLPGVDLYRRPADAVFVIGALAALLAGYVAHRVFTWTLPDATTRQRIAEALLLVGGFGIAVALAVAFGRLDSAKPPLLGAALWFALAIATLWAIDWMRVLRPLAAGLLLAGVTAADLAWNNGPNGASALPIAEIDMLQPATRNETIARLKSLVAAGRSETRRDRVEIAGLGFHWPNAGLTHGLESTLGYNPVRSRLYAAATGAEDTVGLPDQRKFTPLFPSYRSRLADLLGLRYIATGVPIEQMDKRLAPGALPLVARTADAYIYENPGALPRVLLATEERTADFAALLRNGMWPEFDPVRTVLLEQPRGPKVDRRPGSARILSYQNTEVVIDAESPDGGFVVLNDIRHPWWRVTIDGRPAEPRLANVLFRAVEVPPGRHRIVWSFHPVAGAIAEVRARMAVSVERGPER
jgi:hypothetical protein